MSHELFLMCRVAVTYLAYWFLAEFFGITLGGYGYINRSGKTMIRKRDKLVIESFSCERAIQYDGFAIGTVRQKCFIDKRGRIVTQFFEDAEPFSEGLAAVKLNSRSGFINTSGEIVIPCIYDDAEPFVDGMAAVCLSGKWGFINVAGEQVVHPQFNCVMYFSEALAAVEVDGKLGYISQDGSIVIQPGYEKAGPFSDGLALVNDCDYINRDGSVVFSRSTCNYADVHCAIPVGIHAFLWHGLESRDNPISNRRVLTVGEPKNGRFGRQYGSTIHTFSEGLAVACRENKFGYINREGKFFIEPRFDFALPFREERAIVCEDGFLGFIDKLGVYKVAPQFERAYGFSEGLALAKFQNDRWGFVDPEGNVVIEPKYSSAKPFSNGFAQIGSLRSSF